MSSIVTGPTLDTAGGKGRRVGSSFPPAYLILITSFNVWHIILVPVLRIQPSSNPDILFSENWRTNSLGGDSFDTEIDLSSTIEIQEMVLWCPIQYSTIYGYIGLQRFTVYRILLFCMRIPEIPYSDSYVN
jgi:hypothetical protein